MQDRRFESRARAGSPREIINALEFRIRRRQQVGFLGIDADLRRPPHVWPAEKPHRWGQRWPTRTARGRGSRLDFLI